MSVYYNEIERYPAKWLVNLGVAGHIPVGEVSTADIRELSAGEVQGYDQAHFFAGIGGWAYALRLAGWGDRPVWTGSCPCQPFSAAGKRRGTDDARHLWPVWKNLIADVRPPVIFGEQVASPLGREWLTRVQTELETLGYRFGAADLCAAGLGAPHIRQRLFWVADAGRSGDECGLRPEEAYGEAGEVETEAQERQRSGSNPWGGRLLIPCGDGKARGIEPGLEPLAHGVPCRVGKLRAYGNAIVPQVAATFIRAYLMAIKGAAQGDPDRTESGK